MTSPRCLRRLAALATAVTLFVLTVQSTSSIAPGQLHNSSWGESIDGLSALYAIHVYSELSTLDVSDDNAGPPGIQPTEIVADDKIDNHSKNNNAKNQTSVGISHMKENVQMPHTARRSFNAEPSTNQNGRASGGLIPQLNASRPTTKLLPPPIEADTDLFDNNFNEHLRILVFNDSKNNNKNNNDNNNNDNNNLNDNNNSIALNSGKTLPSQQILKKHGPMKINNRSFLVQSDNSEKNKKKVSCQSKTSRNAHRILNEEKISKKRRRPILSAFRSLPSTIETEANAIILENWTKETDIIFTGAKHTCADHVDNGSIENENNNSTHFGDTK